MKDSLQIGALLITLLYLTSPAATQDAKIYGEAVYNDHETYTAVENPRGRSVVITPARKTSNSVLDTVYINASIPANSSATLKWESSNNDFRTVAGTETFTVQDGENIVQASGNLTGNSFRQVLQLDGQTQVTYTGRYSSVGTSPLVFIVTIISIVGVLITVAVIAANKKRTQSKIWGLLMALIIMFAGSTAAFSYTFEPSSPFLEAENSQLQVFDLDPNTNYQLYGSTASGAKQITSFSTDANGNAQVTFDFKPFLRNLQLSTRGYEYQIRKGGSTEEIFTLANSPVFTAFDTFTDGQVMNGQYTHISVDCDSGGGLSETGGELIASCDDSTRTNQRVIFNRSFSENDMINAEYKITPDTFPGLVLSHSWSFFNSQTGNSIGSVSIGSSFYQDIRAHYNSTENAVQVWNNTDSGRQLIGQVATQATNFRARVNYNYDDSVNTEIKFREYSIVPQNGINKWDSPATFQPDAGSFKISQVSEILNPDIAYKGSTGQFTDFISDLGTINEFSARLDDNTSISTVYHHLNGSQVFTEIRPDDGTLFRGDTFTGSTNINIPSGYSELFFSLQFHNGTSWENTEATFSSPDSLCIGVFEGSSITGDDVKLGTGACDNQVINVSADISTVEDAQQWRYKLDNTNSLLSSKTGVFLSDARTFFRDLQEPDLEVIRPGDGVTVLSLVPEFFVSAETAEPGTLRLKLKPDAAASFNTERTWQLGDPVNRNFASTPSTSLTDDNYTTYLEFTGVSGQVTESPRNNFTVNSGLFNAVNVTQVFPENGDVLQDGTFNLRYNVSITAAGSADVYLNSQLIDRRSLSTGDNNNLSTPVFDLDVGNYYWNILINSTGINADTVSSGVNRFEVTENVSISSDYPRDGTEIGEEPVLVNGTLSTTETGVLRLFVDGKQAGAQQISQPVQNLQLEDELVNLDDGKHSYFYRFTSDSSGENYNSRTKSFRLRLGAGPSQGDGGSIGDFLASTLSSVTGLGKASLLMIFSLLVTTVLTIGIGLIPDKHKTQIMTPTFVTGILAFSIAGWFPWAAFIILAVISAVIFATAISGGRD